MEQHEVYLCIGGNLGEREANLEEARMCIEFNMGDLTGVSPVAESDAWGMTDAPRFLNQIIRISTSLSPEELMQEIHELEEYFGRTRKAGGYISREMDVDILSYDQVVVSAEDLEIPHPRMHLRRFVLVPLAALNPDWMHPVLKKSALELLNACEDKSEVVIHG